MVARSSTLRFRSLIPCLALLAGACAAPPAAEAPAATEAEPAAVAAQPAVERGRYLVAFGGCNDCHTPWAFDTELGMPVPDMSRALSGHPAEGPGPEGSVGPHDIGLIGPTFTSFALPFGTVYSANLTPDVDTGLGSWTEEMWLTTFRKGRHMGGSGRPVLPPMPWMALAELSDDDLLAILAYLRSVPPVHNPVPSPEVPEEVMWALRDSFDKLLAAQADAAAGAP